MKNKLIAVSEGLLDIETRFLAVEAESRRELDIKAKVRTHLPFDFRH